MVARRTSFSGPLGDEGEVELGHCLEGGAGGRMLSGYRSVLQTKQDGLHRLGLDGVGENDLLVRVLLRILVSAVVDELHLLQHR